VRYSAVDVTYGRYFRKFVRSFSIFALAIIPAAFPSEFHRLPKPSLVVLDLFAFTTAIPIYNITIAYFVEL
jgi:hypothetical protein